MDQYIQIDPEIMRWKPTIKWTRITVDFIISQLWEWKSMDYLLENYPNLKKEHIYAALKYASNLLKDDHIEYV